MTATLLALAAGLALTDAGFAGYRDGAGRDGRIFKEEFYRRAIRRGLLLGVRVVVASAVWVALLVLTAPHWRETWAGLQSGFTPLVLIGGSYATLVLAALGLWTVGEPDVRCLASVLILGPFTLIRPYVILAMLAFSVRASGDMRGVLCVALPCVAQLFVGRWLGRGWRHASPLLPQ